MHGIGGIIANNRLNINFDFLDRKLRSGHLTPTENGN
jgi:hypothetical protein